MAQVAGAALGHVRHFSDPAMESAHQPVKIANLGGNGHDDASRAMQRMVQTEVLSRLSLSAPPFGIPDAWRQLPGMPLLLSSALP